VRELAGWAPDRYDLVLSWSLREALLAYEQKLKKEARASYFQETVIFSILAPWTKEAGKPPQLPDILKD
jgi:hypothetical protein